jgi:hypothetical protein
MLRVKRLSKARVKKSWEEYRAGKKIAKRILDGYERKVFPLTPSTLAVERTFYSKNSFDSYLLLAKNLASKINSRKPKHFKVVSPKVLAINESRLQVLEKVFPTVDVNTAFYLNNMNGRQHRYQKNYERMLKRNGLTIKEAQEILATAWAEFRKLTDTSFDRNVTNTLVIDIRKKGKVVFMPIDLIQNK